MTERDKQARKDREDEEFFQRVREVTIAAWMFMVICGVLLIAFAYLYLMLVRDRYTLF